ncbi:GNAT family N-acetyltransferase [Kribbella sp. NPDC058693]|uniref:GNAT family N-acetyltransferase n=1 Tax=Kribbella jiaozuonensis TaxID=2575441 RepID=A0A4U3LQS1_9ACTN|nr:GNAT family N-acetyltransferase [Kribbella jiaozuonensis]TKK78060.1 GNAT family N-acetyltransferase [Kribbella jiaozuonensis]
MSPADYGAVLALNNAAVGLVDPLGADRLDWLRLIAAHAAIIDLDGKPAGFVLTFTPGSAYDGLEFDWFTQTYANRFLLIERIVVATEHRREGIGSQVYRAIERAAKPFDRAVVRVRTHPLDDGGLTFHTARGYVQIDKQRLPDGTPAILLTKELAD